MPIKYKKCVVLDLDNTLWGGVVGEEGLEGIKLALTEPGSYFIAFQQALLDLSNKGVVLAINSKNNPNDALEVIRKHKNMILKEHHFSAMRINWQDKPVNMLELAKEINIGLDTMVFLDDDPMQRAAMKSSLPEVEVPTMPADPADYAKFLLSLPYFPKDATTDEDKMRTNMYVTERLRSEAQKQFSNMEDFFRTLRLEMRIKVNDRASLARLAQLSEKTNQFNVYKRPMDIGELERLMNNPEYMVVCGSVMDRFGDYGITNMAVVHAQKTIWEIESYLMSCRVMGRGIETAFLKFIDKLAEKNDMQSLMIRFEKTEKNKPAEDFINKHFREFNIKPGAIVAPDWITIKHENIQ